MGATDDSKDPGAQNLRWLYTGDAIGSAIDQMMIAALPLYALTRVHLPDRALGMVLAGQYLPALLVAQWTAHHVDRSSRTRAMSLASAIGLMACLGLALLPHGLGGESALLPFLGLAMTLGFSTMLYSIASTAVAPTVRSQRPVEEVIAGQASVRTVARAVGLGAAGPLLDLVGGTPMFLLLAAAQLLRAVGVLRMEVGRPTAAKAGDGAAQEPAQSTWRVVWSQPTLWLGLLGVFLTNIGGAIVAGSIVAYAYQSLHMSPTTIGIVMTLGMVAALASLRWARRAMKNLAPGRICAWSGLAVGVAMWILSLGPTGSRWQALGTLTAYYVIFGVASTLLVVSLTVLRQRVVPNRQLARVASISSTLTAASIVGGGALSAVLLSRFGSHSTLVVGAAVSSLAMPVYVAMALRVEG